MKLCKEEFLDKIKAEIAREKQKINFKRLDAYEKAQAEMRLSTLNELLQIIDKYKTESEDKCKKCKYYRNPDYTRCHECKAESED